MNEFEARLFEKLMDENNGLRTEAEQNRRTVADYWTVRSERDSLKKRVKDVEAVLTERQREKVDKKHAS